MTERTDRSHMLHFRPHHFLCSLGYQGKGYSTQFTANMDRIVVDHLHAPAGFDTRIRIVGLSDDICAPCPHRRGDSCEKAEKITALDKRHADQLELQDGQVVTWNQARERIRERVTPQLLDTLCAGCEWLNAGMCKQAVAQLRDA